MSVHRALAWDHNIRQYRHSAIEQKTSQPRRTRKNLRKKRKLLPPTAANQFLHAVANVAFPLASHGGVDGGKQRGEARCLRPRN